MTAKRLLVIDDEPEFAEFVRKVGSSLGYDVEVTTYGGAFMRVYETFDPTVIVLDIVMPQIDGVELVRWLIERRSSARLIVITGYNPDYARLAGKLGQDRGLQSVTTLTKPVTVSHF